MVEAQSLSVSCGIRRVSRRRGKEGLPKGAQRPGCGLWGDAEDAAHCHASGALSLAAREHFAAMNVIRFGPSAFMAVLYS